MTLLLSSLTRRPTLSTTVKRYVYNVLQCQRSKITWQGNWGIDELNSLSWVQHIYRANRITGSDPPINYSPTRQVRVGSAQVWYENVQLDVLSPTIYHTWWYVQTYRRTADTKNFYYEKIMLIHYIYSSLCILIFSQV